MLTLGLSGFSLSGLSDVDVVRPLLSLDGTGIACVAELCVDERPRGCDTDDRPELADCPTALSSEVAGAAAVALGITPPGIESLRLLVLRGVTGELGSE